MKQAVFVPSIISSLRIAALPAFVYLYNLGNVAACLILLAFCAFTDFLDGYSARKLGVTTQFGIYYDSATDFLLMFGIYVFFVTIGNYPFWLPVLIVIAFLQFLVTSIIFKKLYDPVGKYLGSTLYIGVVLTLTFPLEEVFSFVQYAFLGYLLVSIISRIISIKRSPNNP